MFIFTIYQLIFASIFQRYFSLFVVIVMTNRGDTYIFYQIVELIFLNIFDISIAWVGKLRQHFA